MTRGGVSTASLVAVLIGFSPPVHANAIQYALVSRSNGQVMVEIRLTCSHRYDSQDPAAAAREVVLSLTRLGACTDAAGDDRRDTVRPAGREMADLEEVNYETRGATAAVLRLSFREPALVEVSQESDPRSLRIVVTPQPGGNSAAPARRAPQPAPPAVPSLSAEQQARIEARLRALASRSAPSVESGGDYAINLASLMGQPDASGITPAAAAGRQAYVVESELDGQQWQQLRLGFFRTEREAEQALDGLRIRYPNAWVVHIGAADHARAGVSGKGTTDAGPVPAVRLSQSATATLAPEDLDALMAEARSAVLDRKFDRAILLYTQVLGEPRNAYSREAAEFIGVARDRNGQFPQAIAQYRQYLADYPDGDGASRVSQRLVALTTARDLPKSGLRASNRGNEEGSWDAFGSFSQYYRRDSGDYAGVGMATQASLVQSDGDLSVRRHGDTLDFAGRATLGYDYNLLKDYIGPGNRTRIYNLYADLSERDWGLEARVGRQTERSAGVLGRYDGAHISWLLRPDIKLNLLAGFPVYLSSDSLDTSRHFYGVSADFNQLLKRIDASIFLNTQAVDGITDRQGVGGEFRYFDGTRSVIGLVDYDFGFGTLNTLSLIGNWTFRDGTTVSASADYRRSPFPLTENALIGQTALSIDELLHSLTEEQIRQLAVDRSGKMLTYTVGASRPLAERWQVNLDFTATQVAEGPGSGGVLALPDSAVEYYFYASLVGSSLFTEGDVSTVGVRYGDTAATRISAVYLDSRYPLTSSLRLNPRLTLSYRQILADNSREVLVRPSMRLQYRFARHYEIELEGGGDLGRQSGGVANSATTAYYIYAGYRAEF